MHACDKNHTQDPSPLIALCFLLCALPVFTPALASPDDLRKCSKSFLYGSYVTVCKLTSSTQLGSIDSKLLSNKSHATDKYVFTGHGAIVQVDPSNVLVIPNKTTLTFQGLSIEPSGFYGAFSHQPPSPYQDLNMLGVEVQEGAKFVLLDCQLLLRCNDWDALHQSACARMSLRPNSISGFQFLNGTMLAINLTVGDITWTNVSLPYPYACDTPQPSCNNSGDHAHPLVLAAPSTNDIPMEGWQLGLIIGGSIIGAILFSVIGVLMWTHYNHSSDLNQTNEATPKALPESHSNNPAFSSTPESVLVIDAPHASLRNNEQPVLTMPPSDSRMPLRDTEQLLAEIFKGEASCNALSSVASEGSLTVPEREIKCAKSRAQIRLEMDTLCDELQSGVGQKCQWHVTGQLGKGAFGVVYKGTWRGLNVAIKRVIFQVLSGSRDDDMTRKTALREAAINASLDHPNCVPTYTYDMQPLGDPNAPTRGFTDWQMHIIQEYCDCGSLFDAIQDRQFHDPSTGRVYLDHVLAVAADIAAGCAYIHSKQIIHGDLKPDNVLLKGRWAGQDSPSSSVRPVAKIADFGMSMNIRGGESHISGVRHGTPLYVAPEILKNGKASKSADVYSFGVILWELFHGIHAWQHVTQLTGATPDKKTMFTFHGKLFSYDSDGSHIPPSFSKLGHSCLDEDPEARPTFAEIQQALYAIHMHQLTQPAPENLAHNL